MRDDSGLLHPGTEVEAVGLVNAVELNGKRGFVIGHQPAPNGKMLNAVRFEQGQTRLLGGNNLRGGVAAPLLDLTGTWGCWYGHPHVFQQEREHLHIIDLSTGQTHQGHVLRGKRARPDPSMKVIRADHPRDWWGPFDEEPRGKSQEPSSPRVKKLELPWAEKRKKTLLTVFAMGTSGEFDGDKIYWKTGSTWVRKGVNPTTPPRLAAQSLPPNLSQRATPRPVTISPDLSPAPAEARRAANDTSDEFMI